MSATKRSQRFEELEIGDSMILRCDFSEAIMDAYQHGAKLGRHFDVEEQAAREQVVTRVR